MSPATAMLQIPLFCAIDTPDLAEALALARLCEAAGAGIKLGLEFFVARGAEGVRAVVALGVPVFLDLKFHDIPNTVAAACREAARLGVSFLTVHAAGGTAMLQAAVDGVETGTADRAATGVQAVPPRLLAVTVLTSLAAEDLSAIGVNAAPETQVLRLAGLARVAGVDGVVCSAHELLALRQAFGPDLLTVVPGIRPEWAATGDQKRTMTPAEARQAGADYLVIGRPITASADPAAALARIRADLA
jgi:orotidine-5'-phosphate decarboxylase